MNIYSSSSPSPLLFSATDDEGRGLLSLCVVDDESGPRDACFLPRREPRRFPLSAERTADVCASYVRIKDKKRGLSDRLSSRSIERVKAHDGYNAITDLLIPEVGMSSTVDLS